MVGFANSAMLVALAALSVPILLHLMKRQRVRTVVFPSIRFLRRRQLPQEGRRKLRDIPLLLLRLLMVALFALAFSRPFWRSADAVREGEPSVAETEVVFLDASASMAAGDVMQRARQAVLERIRSGTGRAGVGVVVSAQDVVESAPPEAPPSEAESLVRAAKPTFLAGDAGPALAKAVAMLPADGSGRLVIVSDFQTGDWQGVTSQPLPPGTEVEFVPVDLPAEPGFAVADAKVRAAGGQRMVVTASIRSFANSATTVAARLNAAGRVLDEREVEVPARGVATVELTAETYDSPEAVVRISSDRYERDDSFHVWLGAAPPPEVLVVAPVADVPEVSSDVFFLRQALSLNAGGAQRRYTVENADAQFLFGLNPGGYSAMLLVRAAGHLNEEALNKVHRFAQRGACVIVFPGARAGTGFRGLREHDILAARYQGIHRVDPPAHLDDEAAPPLKEVFAAGGGADLGLTQVRKMVRIQPEEGCEVVLSTEDGAPVVVRQSVGKGKVFVFTVAASSNWSDLPLRMSFVPLLHELLRTSLPERRAIPRIECGQTPPSPPQLLEGAVDRPAAAPDTSKPGIVRSGGRPVEVNVSRRESERARVSLVRLRETLTGSAALAATGRTDSAASDGADAAGGRNRPFWSWLAVAAAIALIAEMLMVGRGQEAPPERTADAHS